MTREQLIVIGFIAGAFVAGWLVHALTGDRPAERTDTGERLGVPGEQVERALEESWGALERALRAYHETVLLSLGSLGRLGRLPASPASEGTTLAEEVAAALRSDAANRSMLGAVSADRNALTDFELDLADWGFAYGVAWALARERRPRASDDEIAREALSAAESVFRAYTQGEDWIRPVRERVDREGGRANDSDAIAGASVRRLSPRAAARRSGAARARPSARGG